MQTPENLREKLRGKNHGAKREIPLNPRDYKEFSALLHIRLSRVGSFAKEEEIDFYS